MDIPVAGMQETKCAKWVLIGDFVTLKSRII